MRKIEQCEFYMTVVNNHEQVWNVIDGYIFSAQK